MTPAEYALLEKSQEAYRLAHPPPKWRGDPGAPADAPIYNGGPNTGVLISPPMQPKPYPGGGIWNNPHPYGTSPVNPSWSGGMGVVAGDWPSYQQPLSPQQQQWAQQLYERKQAFIRAHPELMGKGDAMRQAMDKEFDTGLPQNRPPGQIPTQVNDEAGVWGPTSKTHPQPFITGLGSQLWRGSNPSQQFGQFPPMGLPTQPMGQGMPQQFSQEDRLRPWQQQQPRMSFNLRPPMTMQPNWRQAWNWQQQPQQQMAAPLRTSTLTSYDWTS